MRPSSPGIGPFTTVRFATPLNTGLCQPPGSVEVFRASGPRPVVPSLGPTLARLASVVEAPLAWALVPAFPPSMDWSRDGEEGGGEAARLGSEGGLSLQE